MKLTTTVLSILFIVSCAATDKEKTYIGSTPANAVVKTFLDIPLSDSIDFIRWELFIRNDQYHLHYNYGISKPNTNGFINGGVKKELSGSLKKEKLFYQLQNGNKTLEIAEVNDDLLHLLDANNNLLIGNGGWSYTLNNKTASGSAETNLITRSTVLKDSMVFDGRTPCKVPGVVPTGTECYKLKWRIILYSNAEKNTPGTYKVLGTTWRNEGGRKGDWKIITGKNGRIIYQLNDEKGSAMLYLLKLDENILEFTDANGKLLVGDEDFSYTLNRIF